MRSDHYLCLALTPAAQAILLFAALPNSRGSGPSMPFVILALVVPLGCYVWGLRDAPLAKTSRRAVRFLLLGLVAVGLTVGGFVYGLEIITAHNALK